ncbi:NAD-dependent epimerase/dehydratase family protein [Candidatus Woesearchaeota archaeon]|nr:NAD-dependent epimerase/dehydratase family protein [Candidatus Woesearchaeota archaeon]
MNVIVTGGAGFIGSNIALELDKKHKVTVIDSLFSGYLNNLKGFNGRFINLDVTDEKVCNIENKADVIIHQAAITDPRYENDHETFQKNVKGFKNILKLAKKSNAKVIYASTANLYGNGPFPMSEDQDVKIISVYGKSKLEIEKIAATLHTKMHIVGLRYFNVYGPRESGKGRPASMIYHLWKQMRQDRKPRLFKFGEQKRDQIYVKDVVTANLLAMNAPSGVYNVGTGKAVSFNEIVRVLNDLLGTQLDIEYIDCPYNEETYQNNTQANTAKAEKYLGFKAKYSFRQGVKNYHDFLVRQEDVHG